MRKYLKVDVVTTTGGNVPGDDIMRFTAAHVVGRA
jgi:hypothetical protein